MSLEEFRQLCNYASVDQNQLRSRKVQHIAAGRGHSKALTFLIEKCHVVYGSVVQNAEVPVNLMGLTPLGIALLNMELKAK
jgi:hypothetical protein